MSYENLLNRFLSYVRVNTRSNPDGTTTPSIQTQVNSTLNALKPEMEAVGLQDAHYLINSYLVGTLPANGSTKTRKISFITHMDTADFNAEGIRPQVIENYAGGAIELGQSGHILNPEESPNLNNYLGQTLVTTDGTTLPGSDDKLGIAEIMTTVEYSVTHPEIKHGRICVDFGPNEEIGVGADRFGVDDFDVDFTYTADDGPLGEIQYETFSATALEVDFMGRNVHPGIAKNQMINALQLAIDFHNQLPEDEHPENTEGYKGFFRLHGMEGTVEEAYSSYITRDFEDDSFESRKKLVQEIADKMNAELGKKSVIVNLHDQYYNMKKVIEKGVTPAELAKKVMGDLEIKPVIEPICDGTDGLKISFMGIPTPSLFTDDENMHGRFEFVGLQTMERAMDVTIGIVQK